jgi:hypothetical protein
MAVANDSTEIAAIVESALVDTDWYMACNPDVGAAGLDPSTHFVRCGWRDNRLPNAWFDPGWYLMRNPDVAASGINPLLHYIRYGEAEGRRPSAHFDPLWYQVAHDLPDGTFPLRHYLTHRADGKFSPSLLLYAAPFLPQYCDDLQTGADPYLHCAHDAARIGRDPAPDIGVVAASGLVDPNYYLINGADVRDAALDAAEHFCTYGWRENRKPNIHFNTLWHLQTNPIIARMQLNPLVYYICEGEAAGRRPAVHFDPIWYRQAYREALEGTQLGALAHYLAHRRTQAFSPNGHFNVAWYVARYGAELGANREPFAHYLQMGTTSDLDPSPNFDAARYRRRYLGRTTRGFRHMLHPERDNPLMHYLHTQYR